MKRILLSFILMLILALGLIACELPEVSSPDITPGTDSGNDGDADQGGEHICTYVLIDIIDPTCSKEGKKVFECSCGKVIGESIKKSAHIPKVLPGKEASCTEDGWSNGELCDVCGITLTEREPISRLGHTEVIDPATDGSDGTPALTEGSHCGVCGAVIVEQRFVFADSFSDPESYDGDYALESLKALDDGDALAGFYALIDSEADRFHSDGRDVTDEKSIVFTVNYEELSLDTEQAIAVWCAYRMDHPLYYWIDPNIFYTSRELSVVVSEEYREGAVRASYNSRIYAKVKDYFEKISSGNVYMTAMTLHDLIITDGDYAYLSDGVTPSDAASAHNIIGMMIDGEGVCESYAKTFQLLLNYSGIENCFVSGYAGEPHAWNLVKLDDGEWYWFDLTWDDTPDTMWGISYRYFCVTDNEPLGMIDGPWIAAPESFLGSHQPKAKADSGMEYFYGIPERSENKFDGSDIMLRDTFNVDGLTYAVAGYDSVQLVSVSEGGRVVIPESVTYGGKSFKVISVGRIENGLFNIGSIAFDYQDKERGLIEVSEIVIPKTVIFIWDGAFGIDTLEAITVDEDNECFKSVGGVLFTEDMKVLIKYPSGKADTTYVIPDTVVEIAEGAFSMFYINLDLKLESIKVGLNTKYAGLYNRGYGYKNAGKSDAARSENEWQVIASYLSGEAKIYDCDGNEIIINVN